MNGDTIKTLSYFSVLIPFVTCLFIYKKIDRKYYPFRYFIFLIAFTDLAAVSFGKSHLKYYISNVNTVVETCFTLWMFHEWGLFHNRVIVYRALLGSLLAVWILERFYYGNFVTPNFFSSTIGSFTTAFLTIALINHIAISERGSLVKSPLFIIAIGFIVFDTFPIITSAFSLDYLNTSKAFYSNIAIISDLSVTLSYFIFTYAIIMMARQHSALRGKQPYEVL